MRGRARGLAACHNRWRVAAIPRWLPAVLLSVAMAAGAALADPWTEVPRPAGGSYASAMRAGHAWLYAAWCVPTGTTVGLFRTPIASPGSWENLGLYGHPIHDLLLLGANDDTVFVAANSDTCVYRSFDGGQTWQAGDTGLSIESAHALAWGAQGRLLMEGRDAGSGGYERRLVSDDLGASWLVTGEVPMVNYKPFLAAPSSGPQLFFETYYNGFWMSEVSRSTDGGATFGALGGEFWTFSHDLDVSPADPTCVCALMGETTVGRWCGTADLGGWTTPWTAVGAALPAWDPGRLFLAGLDAQGRPMAAWRDWSGDAWHDYSAGLPSTGGQGVMNQWLSFQLAGALDAPLLFFATKDHGLWRREVTELISAIPDIDAATTAPGTIRIAPNPAAGLTWLRAAGAARFAIYAPTGRLVRSLVVNDRSASGSRASWDGLDESGRAVPPGVYFVRGEPSGAEGRILRVR